MSGIEPPEVTRKAWFLALARRYVRRRLSRSFEGVWVAGIQNVATRPSAPRIVAANHVAWWDAFFIVLLDELLGTESYCLMETANLRRYPFFGWIGAVPLDRSSPRQALRDLKSSVALLDRPNRLLWVFPQGRQRPAHLRPLGLERGIEKLAQWSGAPVVPLSLTYAFREAPQPAVLAAFGPPMQTPPGSELSLIDLERRIVEGLNEIDRVWDEGIDPEVAGFARLIRGRQTGSEEGLGGRLLTARSDPREAGGEHG